jgi:tripartite-type tricarboxylate transporter receptor subunit TctC
MITDIMAGQIEMGSPRCLRAGPAQVGHPARDRRAGQEPHRLAARADFAEQGFPVDAMGWFAVVAPARLPAAQVKRLHEAVLAAFNDPEVKAAMARQDNVINPGSPEAARGFLKSEQERYARIVARAQLKPD